MSTRSSARNLFPPLDNSKLTIRRRSHTDPSLLNNSEMVAEGNGDLPVLDLYTIEELCQPSLNGQGGPIALIAIQATNFGLKNDMIQQSIKVNGVTDDALRLYLFPHSLTHHATTWFDRLPRNSINTFEQMAKMFLEKYFPPSMVTKLRNKITNFHQRLDESLFEACERYKLSIDRCPNHNMLPVTQIDTLYSGLTLRNRDTINAAAGGTFLKRPTVGQTQNVYAAGAYQGNSYQPQGNHNLLSYRSDDYLGPPGNTITNPKEDLKGITTRSGTAYPGPTIATTSSSPVVECETGATKDMVHPNNNGSTKYVQPLVVPTESQVLNSKPVISSIIEPVASPVFLLKKLPKKLGDLGKFLIPCDFLGMAECLALDDLGASINLMPLSMWNKLSLPDLSPTCMTLELADHSISRPVGVAEDVFVKVGELTLHVGKEAITFNPDQTSRYSANYNNMTANRIDVIDMACKEYSQEVLGFSNLIASGNPTPYYDPIVFTTSLTLTPFENSDFLLEEVDAFLALEDDPTSPKVDQSYLNSEGDIILLEAFLNDDPSLPPSNQENYLPQVQKELKIYLSVEEKTALITVLKSHKRAIAWKLSDIKGIDPEFCTHKILMEEDFEPANFKVVHKSSISFKDTSQISSIHSIAPIQSTKEPEHLLSMGYEHLSITPETESDKVKESNAENLLPIPSKCEVTLEDEIKCDIPAKDVCSPVFTTFANPLFKDNDDLDSSDDESLFDEDVPAEEFKIYSNPLCNEDEINSDKLDPHCFNIKSDFVESLLNRDTPIDFSSKFDFSGELAHIKPEIPKSDFNFEEEIRLIENLLYDNSFPRPPKELNAEIADTIIESIPLAIPVQDGNSQQEEIDIVTETNDVLPPSIENFTDDPEGDIHFLEELLINDSIFSDELSDANFKENPLIPRPPPKPPDVETDAGEEIAVVMINKDKFDDDYQIFMFDKVFSLLSAESEDTIFDPEPWSGLFRFECLFGSVPVHRQTGTFFDNHNHHVNCFHINCTSNSRTEVVE
nr:reverse transcriptase domain-containing protein [Tanacetum cinerariifolium]